MMKTLKKWSVCLLAIAMLALMVSCELPFGIGKNTDAASTEETTDLNTETIANGSEETTAPDANTNTTAPDTDTDAPDETKADIRPGKDEDYTWEGYNPFA